MICSVPQALESHTSISNIHVLAMTTSILYMNANLFVVLDIYPEPYMIENLIDFGSGSVQL